MVFKLIALRKPFYQQNPLFYSFKIHCSSEKRSHRDDTTSVFVIMTYWRSLFFFITDVIARLTDKHAIAMFGYLLWKSVEQYRAIVASCFLYKENSNLQHLIWKTRLLSYFSPNNHTVWHTQEILYSYLNKFNAK